MLTFEYITNKITFVRRSGGMADAQASGACYGNIVWVQVPSPASLIIPEIICGSVGTGRRARLRILWWVHRVGSSPIFRSQVGNRNVPDFFVSVKARSASRCAACRLPVRQHLPCRTRVHHITQRELSLGYKVKQRACESIHTLFLSGTDGARTHDLPHVKRTLIPAELRFRI